MVGRGQELELLAQRFRNHDARGALLVGGAGVGKTRLAEKCLELAESAGLPSGRVTGHPEGRAIPFAAFAHLVPQDVVGTGADELRRGHLFHRAQEALRAQCGERRRPLSSVVVSITDKPVCSWAPASTSASSRIMSRT